MSDFRKWFIAQHGKRPSKETLDELMRDRNCKASAHEVAQRLVDDCVEWDARLESALYAWQAKPAKRKP